MTKFITAAFGVAAALALQATPAKAQININIGQPAPQYVVVHEVRTVKKYKAPKHKKGTVVLVPAQPVYVVPRGYGHGHEHGHGHGHGRGKH